MKNLLILSSIWLVLLGACDSSEPPNNSNQQDHQISTFPLQLAGHSFQVELADTPQLRRQGLSGRQELPADHGMLFVFPSPTIASMWMKDCRIPLDVLFFDQDKQIINFHTMPVPLPNQPDHALPVYSSDKPAKYALELPAGTAGRLGVEPGTAVTFCPDLLKALGKGTE